MRVRTLAFLGFALVSSFASATTLVHTYTFGANTDSFDDYGAPGNVVINLNLGAIFPGYSNFSMSGVGWNVTITAEGASWLSEATVEFNNSTADSLDAVGLAPSGTNTPGTATYSNPIVAFSSVPLNNIALNNDNILRMEFFEQFDDVPGVRDGFWHQGSRLDIQVEATAVPEPATMAVLGLGAAALLRRRRK